MLAAVFHGPNKITVEPVPLMNGNANLKVNTCAVCGYDARVFRNGHSKVHPPVILGHELCGTVMNTVSTGSGLIKSGSRVAMCPLVPCLGCRFCRDGNYNLCVNLREIGSTLDGGFAQYVAIPDEIMKIGGLVAVPDGLSDEEAALLEPLACCINSLSRMGHPKGDTSVVIVGDGPIGLIHLQLLKRLAGTNVAVVGKVDSRMQKAKAMGADMVVEYKDSHATAQQILDFTRGFGADAVVVATSSPAASELALRVAAKNSVVNLFAGLPKDQKLSIDANRIHYNQITITGSFGCTPSDLTEAASIAAEKIVDLSGLITHRYSLSEIERAFLATEKYYGLRAVINMF